MGADEAEGEARSDDVRVTADTDELTDGDAAGVYE